MITEQTLKMALNEAKLKERPMQLKDDETRFWVKAVALVRRNDGTLTYTIAERRSDGLVRHTQDFVSRSGIHSLVRVFPYVYLDDSLIPQNGKFDDFILASHYPDADIDHADDEKLERLTRQLVIDYQMGRTQLSGIGRANTEEDLFSDAEEKEQRTITFGHEIPCISAEPKTDVGDLSQIATALVIESEEGEDRGMFITNAKPLNTKKTRTKKSKK